MVNRVAAAQMKPPPRQVIGVDIGGTGLKMGRFDQSGTLLGELEVPTPKPATPGAITSELVKAIAQLDPQRDADAVGIGLPGPMDRSGRVAQVCINLPGWEQVPLAAWLEPRLQRPVTMANDGNCAVLGEQWLGAASGIEDVVMLTLGTGVGGGVILGGELFLGRSGAAAEPGLIGLDPMGPSCNSGNNGSIESYCSIGALTSWAGTEPRELSRRASIGDAEALAVWKRYGELLGCGISSLIYAFTPERVLLGGGLSAAFPFFADTLRQEVERRVLAPSRAGLSIEAAALGNGAGRLGAARIALERLVPDGVG